MSAPAEDMETPHCQQFDFLFFLSFLKKGQIGRREEKKKKKKKERETTRKKQRRIQMIFVMGL
jgi:hypothetical protein